MVYETGYWEYFTVNFEVDSTESVWYNLVAYGIISEVILKLTPQSQYGICLLQRVDAAEGF